MPQFVEHIPFGPSMRASRYRFDNGLTLLLLADHAAPVITYNSWYKVGSRDERAGKTGLAHLFEHLMFNETENRKHGELDRLLEENGAESNAATWLDWTYYHENLPASKLDLVASLEADRLTNLVLRDKQVSSEKEVVANERRFRVDDDVEGAANEILYRLAFERHPYGWPTIGWMEDIEAFSVADCQEFYRTFYAPNNVTLVVVGDFDEQQAVATIDKHYGHLKASSLTARTYPVEPPQSAQKRIEIAKPTTTEKILVGFKSPALASPDHAALSALSEILFEGRSSRFHRLFVKEKELATDVRSFLGSFADPALFEMYFACRDGVTIEQIEPLLAEQIGRLHTVGITDSELEKAKAKLELALLQSLENCAGKAEQMGYYETVLGQPAAAFDKLDRIRGLTRDDVDAVARKYLIETQSSVVVVRCAEQSEDD